MKMTFSKQITPPNGRAERQGTHELQTKLDRFCLYKNMIFFINRIFSKQIKPPYGRAERLGTPELQTKLDRFCLYKNIIFHMNMIFSNRPDVESQKHARAREDKKLNTF